MKIDAKIPELDAMRNYPAELYYRGSLELLSRPKISIVGTRKPNPYTRALTYELSQKLSMGGNVIVSGAALGVDAIAHQGAGSANTIAVLPCGIDLRYPRTNQELIKSIETKGLSISPFEPGFTAREWSFVVRNEIVVALGDILIVTEADINSGSMRSVEFALAMNKTIYVLPHRMHESKGTQWLLSQGKAQLIMDIDQFVSGTCKPSDSISEEENPFIDYCRSMPTYEEAIALYPNDVFEAELNGSIEIKNGRVVVA